MRGRRPGLRRAPPAEHHPPHQQRPGLAAAAPSGPGEAMLPWKRHKFELAAAAVVDGEKKKPQRRRQQQQQQQHPDAPAQGRQPSWPDAQPGPPVVAAGAGKAGAASDSCAAAAAAALGSGPLSRVGHLFRSKRKKFRVSSEAPTYTVLYLGNATTLQAKGDGCTDAAVGKIWAKSEAGRLGTKMKLTIGPQGIRMAPAPASGAGAPRPGHLYLLHRVTYCVADPRLPRLFAWIYRHEVKHKAVLLRCHAVLVSKAEKARAMALLLYQTSAAALAEFRRLKKRADARHQQLQQVGQSPGAPGGAIPLVPLRRLLLRGDATAGPGSPGAAACCYKPPVERSRSAPKLGSITEDALGEELEARAAAAAAAANRAAGGLEECCCQPRRRRRHGGGPEGDDEDRDREEEELPGAPGPDGEGPEGDGGAPGLGGLIRGLGELGIGNDVALLRADLRVTRLLSGESTGSESSIESSGGGNGNGPEGEGGGGGSPQPGRDGPEPDTG